MAPNPTPLTVVLTPAATGELAAIWVYNAERYGRTHADQYEAFLADGIDGLSTEHENGTPVEGHPGLRRTTFKPRRRGHGHIVVYRVDHAAQTVRVFHIYHTAQDIEGRLKKELG